MRKGADLLSKWVGEAEKQLRLLFEEASRHQPAILFFDEIDGLAPVRLSLGALFEREEGPRGPSRTHSTQHGPASAVQHAML